MLIEACSQLAQMPTHTAVALAAISSGAAGYAFKKAYEQKPLPGIPYREAGAYTFAGDIHAMRKEHPDKRRKWLANLPSMLGAPVVQAFLEPFAAPWVIIADYYEAIDIVQRRTRDFDRSPRNFELFGIVIPEHHITMKTSDPRFHVNKKLVKNLKSSRFQEQVSAPIIYLHTMKLIELWSLKTAIAKGRPFEASQDLWTGALDVIMKVAFGLDPSRAALTAEVTRLEALSEKLEKKTETESPETPLEFGRAPLTKELEAFVKLTDAVAMAMRFPIPRWMHFVSSMMPSHRSAVYAKDTMIYREIDASIKRLIDEGRMQYEPQNVGSSSDDDDFIDMRIRCAMDLIILAENKLAAKEGRKPNYHSKTIRDELTGYLIGGHDTTSTTLSWFVKFLSAHQHVQRRLREALYQTHKTPYGQKRPPTHDEIVAANIPYLDAVIEETLRIAGTFPMLIRQAIRDTRILGHDIPAGTNLLILTQGPSYVKPPFDIPTDKRTDSSAKIKSCRGDWEFDTMGQFMPERWLKSAEYTADDGTTQHRDVFDNMAGPSMPFGAGLRSCFGRRLAMLELRMVITLLVWHFELGELPEGLDSMESLARMTNQPEVCFVSLTQLQDC